MGVPSASEVTHTRKFTTVMLSQFPGRVLKWSLAPLGLAYKALRDSLRSHAPKWIQDRMDGLHKRYELWRIGHVATRLSGHDADVAVTA